MLKKCAKRGGKKILLGWNRGLGDIALGLFPMIEKIRELVPNAEISFLTRSNLKDGFSLLRGIDVLVDPNLRRGEKKSLFESLKKLNIDPKSFDLIIPQPSPTDWMALARGKVTPKLEWEDADLWKKFDLSEDITYIGVQAVVETSYGQWRNWPLEHWEMLFSRLEQMPNVTVLLLGGDEKTPFKHKNLIDLRGKTSLFELLSILRNKCSKVILPDSGILSMVYYLNAQFPIHVVSLWGDPNHGILKQAVPSPNKQLCHTPLIGALKDLSTVSVDQMMNTLFPVKPLKRCTKAADVRKGSLEKVGCIVLAGGQGSRLGIKGPKGTFLIHGKSLFEWISEKAPKESFPIAVMTSPLNHSETISFFEKNGFFGKEVYFFQQEMEPFLDEKKKPTHFLAPSGNGSVFRSFVKSGLFSLFKGKGIDLVTIIPVDNPLADPADQKLIGYAREKNADVTIKCIESQESMGALVERGGKIEIQEYIYQDPSSTYYLANTGMLAISIPFIEKVAKKELPFHLVRKEIPGTKKWGWKREQFIFDALPFGTSAALCYQRDACYAPIKNKPVSF